MPSRDTIVCRISKSTKDELENIRKVISKELGINIEEVRYKHAETAFRLMAKRGKVFVKELQDILLGKIK